PLTTGTPVAPRIVGCKLVTPRVVNVPRPSITPTRVAPSTPSSLQRPMIGLTNNQQSPSTPSPSSSGNNRRRVSQPFHSNSRKNLHQQLLLKRLMRETTTAGEQKTIETTDRKGIAPSPSSLDRTPLSPTNKLNLN